jgi:hypothetical protein
MKRSAGTKFLCAAALALSLATPCIGSASVALNGCAGGTFGSDCGLNELLAGGSFSVNGTQFTTFSLDTFARPLDTSLIRVAPIDSLASPGFTLIDAGGTLRAANGDLTDNTLSFTTSSAFRFIGSTLAVQFGEITNPGEFTFADVSQTVFDSSFSLIANNRVLCDTAACANSIGSDSGSFADQSTVIAFLNIIAGSGNTGDVAQINSITVSFGQVPEPSTLALLVLAFGVVSLGRRRPAQRCIAA